LHRPLLVWLFLSAIWGSTWLVIKLGVSELPPFTFAWARFALATTVIYALLKLKGGRLPWGKQDRLVVLISGTCYFTINYALVYWAETRIDSSLAAVLYTIFPLFGLLMAHFFVPNDRITLAKLVGVILGMVGIVFLFYEQLSLAGAEATWGVVAVVFAAFTCAIGATTVKLHAHHIDPLSLTAGQLLVGTVPLCLLGLIVEGNPLQYHWRPAHLLAVGYLGILGTALTFSLLNWLFKHMALTKTNLIPLASTLIAVWLGWWVRGEVLHPLTLIGTLFTFSGLILATVFSSKPSGKT